ncbi:oligosaccharide flippase family protein [Flexivirga sp. ID2601S]|uniref:Oligosaccharide flippase family protein n=1 Tax=Flexivirga aerilata TaxID=1656889 RepID=A0A849AHC8_9MICO|nr:oligosaccharide flippase family protein [Flexivirga aerilata]
MQDRLRSGPIGRIFASARAGLGGRLLRTGLPTLVASGLIYLQPILGRSHLSVTEYSTWALGATVLSMGLILDFGGTAYSVAASASGTLTRAALTKAASMSVAGSAFVGLLSAAIWPSYQAAHHLALPGISGVLFFLSVTLAACLRSLTTIGMGILMAQDRDSLRAALLLGQATLQSVLLYAGLQIGSIWALPASSILASIATAPWFLRHRSLNKVGVAPSDSLNDLRSFAQIKIAFALLSLVLTQADRWVVGALITPTRLAAYDVTSRFAGIPRLVIAGIVGVLVAEASSNWSDYSKLKHIYSRSIVFCSAILIAATGGAATIALILGGTSLPWGLFWVMAAAFNLHAICTVGLSMTTGIGRPIYDLVFVLPAVAIAGGTWVMAATRSSQDLAELAVPIGLILWSPIFLAVVPAGLRPNGKHQAGVTSPDTPSNRTPASNRG